MIFNTKHKKTKRWFIGYFIGFLIGLVISLLGFGDFVINILACSLVFGLIFKYAPTIKKDD